MGFVACKSEEIPGFRQPTVDAAFESLTADGSSSALTTTLTLTFDGEIEGLSADDISIAHGTTGTLKRELTALGAGVYELGVRRIYAPGEIIVTVAKAGYLFTPYEQTVEVFGQLIRVAWNELSQDGSEEEPTHRLTLVLDGDVGEEITEADIALGAGTTGAEKGVMTYLGDGRFELSLRNIRTAGEVSVGIAKGGYEFVPDTRNIAVYPWRETQWISLVADGSAREKSTKLTFTFDSDLEGFSVDDITLNAGKTGATAGELTAVGNGVYELALTGIVESEKISVTVLCSGYILDLSTRSVSVFSGKS